MPHSGKSLKARGRKVDDVRDLKIYGEYRDPKTTVEQVAMNNGLSRSGVYKAVYRVESKLGIVRDAS